MFTLGDISIFKDENSEKVTSCKILKPVWDVITDYLVMFLAILALAFAGMEVTSGSFECLAAVNCPGISRSNTSSLFLSAHMKYRNVCNSFYNSKKADVIKGTDVMTDLKSSIQYAKFVNSECSKSAIPNFLAYFWFVMFIEAFVLIILDNLWLKLPTTAATIESFVSLVMACYASPCSNLDLAKALSDVSNPEIANSISDDSDIDQFHELDILDDTVTVSAVRSLYEKLETLKEINAQSSDKLRVKIWLLYLIQAILEAIFAFVFVTLNIYYRKDLKETMTCTVAQHIPVPHDYFICSHSLAPAFRLGLYLYISVLGLSLLTYIYIIGWTVLKVSQNKCEYDFKKENLPPLAGDRLSDIHSVNEDFGFLLHLLHSYSKLYVVRLAHYLSKGNKKKIQADFLNKKYRVSKLNRQLKENGNKIMFTKLPAIPQTLFHLANKIVTLKLIQCGNTLENEDFKDFNTLLALRKLSVIAGGLECIPEGILKMELLEELNLKGNLITSIDESVSTLKNLTSLDLSDNKLKTIKKGSLEQLDNLFAVYVTGNSGLGKPALEAILACGRPNGRLEILRCSEELSDRRRELNRSEQLKFDAFTSAGIRSLVIPYSPEEAKTDPQPNGKDSWPL